MDDGRASWSARLGDRTAHAEIAGQLASLHELELRPSPRPEALSGWVRVAAWNVERGRRVDDLAEVIRRTGAHIALLTETDVGMARSANVDVPAALASSLGMGAAFGVEFVELGLGDAGETASVLSGDGPRSNDRGLHGNAVLCVAPLRRARPVRIELRGDWFGEERGQPRVGGRMAVVGEVEIDGVVVTVASVHLESGSDADDRAEQLALVLDALGDGPAIVGGDLNTFGAPFAELADRRRLHELRTVDPSRFSWPVDHEPLFHEAARRGFDWLDANLAAPTTNHAPDGSPHHQPLHLDWLLVRGLEARRPTVVPALAPDGSPLSDHHLVAVSVRLLRSRSLRQG